jgi:EAL domain-containing protein (putative c-di-GMP-specific phosphodiesterase class I)
VNLSTRQLQRSALMDEIRHALDASGLPPSRLCLEITESAMLVDTPASTANLAAIKRLGVRLAIDDFGTGYSSLAYLKRFPVDVVKIDRSFISGLSDQGVDREIVTAVIQLARAIGATVVAEGVETDDQLDALRRVGCPQAQGFFLARPLPLSQVEPLLADKWAHRPEPRFPSLEPELAAENRK